ncbi:hypothetical protein SAMN04244560_00318 [Thermoanaerobacter thermohydrosulfuricus]|uniref:Uncharacterized protein n=1 Tax=Thermoanaerobacter thermohydrosulfuricus TaxID=1516 RepID=A0A1G7IRP2_THETY|nr:hypothetical protein [Thermoanaerobacter thermohydrosulfuricus]SDF15400.1 hypothetical protein SAMN04244560_00318 [Thermoanaerobacter thermohydrosulfuricus]
MKKGSAQIVAFILILAFVAGIAFASTKAIGNTVSSGVIYTNDLVNNVLNSK